VTIKLRGRAKLRAIPVGVGAQGRHYEKIKGSYHCYYYDRVRYNKVGRRNHCYYYDRVNDTVR
jgi:hypothetical protein